MLANIADEETEMEPMRWLQNKKSAPDTQNNREARDSQKHDRYD